MKKTVSVMVVDDHPMVREGLAAMLEAEGFDVAALAANGEEAVAAVKDGARPDVVLMDVRMPGMSGFATLEALKEMKSAAAVLFMAGMPLKMELERARREGARGYFSKTLNAQNLANVIRRVAESREVFIEDDNASPMPQPDSPLTPRETEVLQYLALGKSREEVSTILGCGLETVKTHVRSILFKLGINNTAGAVSLGYELGILHTR